MQCPPYSVISGTQGNGEPDNTMSSAHIAKKDSLKDRLLSFGFHLISSKPGELSQDSQQCTGSPRIKVIANGKDLIESKGVPRGHKTKLKLGKEEEERKKETPTTETLANQPDLKFHSSVLQSVIVTSFSFSFFLADTKIMYCNSKVLFSFVLFLK